MSGLKLVSNSNGVNFNCEVGVNFIIVKFVSNSNGVNFNPY